MAEKSMFNTLEQGLGFWRKLSRGERIGILVVVGVVFVVFTTVKVISAFSTDRSKSTWEILLDVGLIGGVVGLLFKFLERKLLGGTAPDPAAAIPAVPPLPGQTQPPAGVPVPPLPSQPEPTFVGLTPHQWFVTLYLVFFAGLTGAILSGFLLGPGSLWVLGPALVVVGMLLVFLGTGLEKNTAQPEAAGTSMEHQINRVVGVSPVLPALPALICACTPLSHHVTWIYLFYALVVFLPGIHVVQHFAKTVDPVKHSAGLWISGGYLAFVFLASTFLAVVITRQQTPSKANEEAKQAVLGTWVESETSERSRSRAKLEFTPGGQVLVTNWDYPGSSDTYKYQFTSRTNGSLSTKSGSHWGDIEIVSADELVVSLLSTTKKCRRGKGTADDDKDGGGLGSKFDDLKRPPKFKDDTSSKEEKLPPVSKAAAEALTAKLVGEWNKPTPLKRGNYQYTRQSVFFAKSGTVRYSASKSLGGGRPTDEEEAGTYEVVAENKIRIGAQTIAFDFLTDDEVIATSRDRTFGAKFQDLDGKFVRVKK